ncbi:MAG: hypothetical protein QOG59_503, partial [Solirubrobacteraceae bacterium]|nr:hypothetical protein [Solirubrobacteraceae bacterium]
MRFATVNTPDGPRLHVRASEGYIDVAQATGDMRLVDVRAVLDADLSTMDTIRDVSTGHGRSLAEEEYAPAIPAPNRILCLGVNYVEHALEGGRQPTKWPEVFVRGADSITSPYGELVKP